jgi:hypothetical protein
MTSFNTMKTGAIAVGVMAAVVLTTLAVIGGFKDTGLVDNATAVLFVNGLKIFGTFVGVVVLALVGKVIIGMFTSK